jgi:hypothetical protein
VPDTLGSARAVETTAASFLRRRTVVWVNVKKIVGFVAIALLIWFVVTQPDGAANSLQNIGGILRDAADSVTRFFTQLL